MDGLVDRLYCQCVVVGCNEPAFVGAYCPGHEAHQNLVCDTMKRTPGHQLSCDFDDYICHLAEAGGP